MLSLPLDHPAAPGIPLMLSCWEANICLKLLFGFTCLVGWLVYDEQGIVSKLLKRMAKVYSAFRSAWGWLDNFCDIYRPVELCYYRLYISVYIILSGQIICCFWVNGYVLTPAGHFYCCLLMKILMYTLAQFWLGVVRLFSFKVICDVLLKTETLHPKFGYW